MSIKVLGDTTVRVWVLLTLLFLLACGTGTRADTVPSATVVPAGGAVETVPPMPPAAASAEPTATAAPTVTPTPVPPSPSPTASAGPASEDAESARLAVAAFDFLETFTRKVSPRESATEQERAAAEFLRQRFEALGYDVRLQPFEVEMERARISLAGEGESIPGIRLSRSPYGEATGLLVDVGRAFEKDIPDGGIDGMIALIERGTISFEEKIARVTAAGAVAAIVYNNASVNFRGTLATDGSIPAVSITRAAGDRLLARLSQGDVRTTVTVAHVVADSVNVIAEMPGADPDGGMVILGGHYDTVPGVPGANDNGSGIAVLMTIASEVADRSYPFTLRFVGFGAEEIGLFGSRFHVESLSAHDLEGVIAMLNFDALGSGRTAGVLGDPALVQSTLDVAAAGDVDVEEQSLGAGWSSDHAPFENAGVPVLFFLSDDFSRIHSPEDRLEFVRPELIGDAAAMAIGMLDLLSARES